MDFNKMLKKPFIGITLVILLLSIDWSESNETTEERKLAQSLLKYYLLDMVLIVRCSGKFYTKICTNTCINSREEI